MIAGILIGLVAIVILWGIWRYPRVDQCVGQCTPTRANVLTSREPVTRTDYISRRWRWRGLELSEKVQEDVKVNN